MLHEEEAKANLTETRTSGNTSSCSSRLRVCSLNVHGWHHSDESSWSGLIATLTATQPDLILLQEATKHRVPALAGALGDLHWTCRHSCAILSRHKLVAQAAGQSSGFGTQVHHSKPSTIKPSSAERGRRFERYCAAIMVTEGRPPIEVVSLHLDHVVETTRMSQLRDLVEGQFSAARNACQIWAGDFNALTLSDYAEYELLQIADHRARNAWEAPRNDVSEAMTTREAAPCVRARARNTKRFDAQPRGLGFTDCWHAAEARCGPLGTSRFASRIDYVYCSPALMERCEVIVRRCEHLQTIPHVSDHNAVLAELQLHCESECSDSRAER